jgi:hypothetical protein
VQLLPVQPTAAAWNDGMQTPMTNPIVATPPSRIRKLIDRVLVSILDLLRQYYEYRMMDLACRNADVRKWLLILVHQRDEFVNSSIKGNTVSSINANTKFSID